MKIRFKRLRWLAGMVEGIPDHKLHLSEIRRNKQDREQHNDPSHCGAIGCVIGFSSLHPKVNDWGLTAGEWTDSLLLRGRATDYNEAARHLFGLTGPQAGSLFGPHGASRFDNNANWATSKDLFRRRIVQFFREHGEPVSAEYLQLAGMR